MTRVLPPPMPPRIRALPKNRQGYPVPWFVAWIDGAPDFRVVGLDKVVDAVRFRLCWICGGPLGANAAFLIGPMCVINRVSAEPPSHRDCATWSAQACPFLTTPGMVRRERGLPDNMADPAGVMVLRNPGVAVVWVTRRWSTFPAPGGSLFDIGAPRACDWYAEGRPATRVEVLAAIESGLPTLTAAADADGPTAVAELARQTRVALDLVPAGAP